MSTAAQRELYETLVRTHAPDLYRFALRMCGDAARAEDLVQETYHEAWRGLTKLRDRQKARAWLFQILRYRYAHWARGQGRADRAHDRLANTPVRAPDPEGGHVASDVLERGLSRLDDRLRIPFLMVFLQGLTCKEAADELGIPLGTVLSRVHRARTQLRKFIDQQDRPRAQLRAVENAGEASP